MDIMTVLGRVIIAIVVLGGLYLAIGSLLIVGVFRLARAQDEIPRSLDCSDGRHRACVTCSCRCHP